MELLTLDSNYQPAELVERYSSLIWTERYSTVGDFQLVSTDVERMLNLLPLESVVTLRESTVPMLVEVHKIEKSITGAPQLTVTGRSFESILERRVAALINTFDNGVTYIKIPWIIPGYLPSDTAYYAIRKIIGDDVDRRTPPITSPTDRFQLGPQDPWISPYDYIPQLDFPVPADFVYLEPNDTTPEYQFEIKSGNLYSVVVELLNSDHHGLKAVRPAQGLNKIGIEIYNGADLRDTVIFDAKFDQFENATYLLSEAGSTNWAYVVSKTNFASISKTTIPEGEEPPTGLERRVTLVDITGEEGVDTAEARRTRGLIELYKYNATALFDGQLSQQIATGYNNDYFLGDIIKLRGEYGLSEDVRVAEFIRSEDSTGSKAYPTFEVVDL
jgi:hypothetical protein